MCCQNMLAPRARTKAGWGLVVHAPPLSEFFQIQIATAVQGINHALSCLNNKVHIIMTIAHVRASDKSIQTLEEHLWNVSVLSGANAKNLNSG